MNFDSIEGRAIEFALWCNTCNAEQATDKIEMEINDRWLELDIGPDCLLRLKQQGKIEI